MMHLKGEQKASDRLIDRITAHWPSDFDMSRVCPSTSCSQLSFILISINNNTVASMHDSLLIRYKQMPRAQYAYGHGLLSLVSFISFAGGALHDAATPRRHNLTLLIGLDWNADQCPFVK
eukprot:6191468-Pleurochrysis_carterae.AAC.1